MQEPNTKSQFMTSSDMSSSCDWVREPSPRKEEDSQCLEEDYDRKTARIGRKRGRDEPAEDQRRVLARRELDGKSRSSRKGLVGSLFTSEQTIRERRPDCDVIGGGPTRTRGVDQKQLRLGAGNMSN